MIRTNSIDSNKDNKKVEFKEEIIDNQFKWTSEDEYLLKEWADHARCYNMLHEIARTKYERLNLKYNIPMIILSTFVGTVNMLTNRIDMINEYVNSDTPSYILGAVSIVVAILGAIYEFFKIPYFLSEHTLYMKQWDKLGRDIKIELIKERNDRMPKKHMVEFFKREYERLTEMSPQLSQDVKDEFKQTVKRENIKVPKNIIKEIDQIQVNTKDIIINIPKSKYEIDLENNNKHIEEEFKKKYERMHGRRPSSIELNTMLKRQNSV